MRLWRSVGDMPVFVGVGDVGESCVIGQIGECSIEVRCNRDLVVAEFGELAGSLFFETEFWRQCPFMPLPSSLSGDTFMVSGPSGHHHRPSRSAREDRPECVSCPVAARPIRVARTWVTPTE